MVQTGLSMNHTTPPVASRSPASPNSERKYNIIVYGIKECPKGSSRRIRMTKDTEAVSSIIKTIDSQISDQSLRDCFRLGKYCDTRTRPILAKLTRSSDVSTILANRGKLTRDSGFSIKPDMTPVERAIESKLLHERRELINTGIERSRIRIRGNTLYLNKKKYGSVVDSVFNLEPVEQNISTAHQSPPPTPSPSTPPSSQ